MHRLKVPEVGVVNKPDDVTIAARRLQGACSATQPIEIVSTAFPDMEGCYFITSSATDTLYFSTNVASAVGIIESQGRVRSETKKAHERFFFFFLILFLPLVSFLPLFTLLVLLYYW